MNSVRRRMPQRTTRSLWLSQRARVRRKSLLKPSRRHYANAGLPSTRSLEPYRAVMVGAPLYIGAWHKDVLNFPPRHREALASRPVAVFALGPLNDVAEEQDASRTQLDKELAKLPWFKPSAVEIFVGQYDPA